MLCEIEASGSFLSTWLVLTLLGLLSQILFSGSASELSEMICLSGFGLASSVTSPRVSPSWRTLTETPLTITSATRTAWTVATGEPSSLTPLVRIVRSGHKYVAKL